MPLSSIKNSLMKPLFYLCFLLLTFEVSAQLNPSTYGNPEDPAIVFLHGGPGYNSVIFEQTTADSLAASGFYVISYDRRGEGRNHNQPSDFDFKQSVGDLKLILDRLNINKVHLLGHSFGGVIAVKFAETHPDIVNSIILAGAPVSMPETLSHIISSSKQIYEERGDKVNLKYIDMLENMDSTSVQYSGYAFVHAMKNGFYSPTEPTAEAKELYRTFKTDSLLRKYAAKQEYEAPQGFWENEGYTTLSVMESLIKLKDMGITLYGAYGREDGLYSTSQLEKIEALTGEEYFSILDDASHNLFVDRQKEFIILINKWLTEP